ncbi:MAG: hypothetical protein IKE24_02160 [Clostridia bacterium]|nr:hypothetical protein [Clostridia bacterium]
MNAKQAARAAKKLEEQAKNPAKAQTQLDPLSEILVSKDGRKNLPGGFEEKYKSEALKQRIADLGMWNMIPAVKCSMNSPEGIKRLEANDVLFTFIDQYFRDVPFAFEPNMQDGRFVFLPHDVSHQGIGICASKDLPGYLEIGQFWYPAEFTAKRLLHIDQVYVAQYSTEPDLVFANGIRTLYTEKRKSKQSCYCTFPFDPDTYLRFDGNFMDQLNNTCQKIQNALKDRSFQVRRNGEALILFLQRIMQ